MNEQNLKISKSSIYKICLIILALLFAFATFIPFLTNYYGKTFGFFNGILEFFDTFIKVDKYSGNPILNFIIYLVFAISILSMCIISFIKNTHYLLNKEEKEVCVSNYDENEEIYYGYPAIINETGIKSRLKLELTLDEQEKLNNSIAIIKKALKELKEKDL